MLANNQPCVEDRALTSPIIQRAPLRFSTAFCGRQGLSEPLCAIYEPKSFPRLLQFVGMGHSCLSTFLCNSPIHLLNMPNKNADIKTWWQMMTNHSGHIVQINDIEMYDEEYGFGKPLLLLHSFGGCSQNWYSFVTSLKAHCRLIAIDLRGHGYSTNPRTSSHIGKQPRMCLSCWIK